MNNNKTRITIKFKIDFTVYTEASNISMFNSTNYYFISLSYLALLYYNNNEVNMINVTDYACGFAQS